MKRKQKKLNLVCRWHLWFYKRWYRDACRQEIFYHKSAELHKEMITLEMSFKE